ncbi:uncharacterized protein [Panulirus ornatus]|uniref:uncharacterized protein isoform X2 n=1 Tax=Panulirus ornatus TaxID=150431 RepID=UPI003A8920CE
MDPHMTSEDEELLLWGAHRRLQQRLSPPRTIVAKKKKLVNFKISRKTQADDNDQARTTSSASYSAVKQETDERQETQGSRHVNDRKEYENINEREPRRNLGDDRRENFENLNVRKDNVRHLNEDRNNTHTNERREDYRNLNKRREHDRNSNEQDYVKDFSEKRHKRNSNKRKDIRNSERRDENRNFNSIDMMSCLSSPDKDGNDNLPSSSQTTECQGPILNQTTSATSTNENPHRRRTEAIPMKTRSLSETSWEKVKLVTMQGGRGARFSNVVEVMANKRKASMAPYIWTPSVPRSAPNPRPANFQDQEEPGKGTYVFSFVSRTPQTRQRQWQKRQLTLPNKQPQSHREWEASGKQYLKWLKGVVNSPFLQEGHLLKGLEMDVHYPVLHISDQLPENVNNGQREKRRRLEGTLGSECNLQQGVYQEVVAWVPELLVTCPSDPSLWARCFIVLGFKTLDGELNKRMEILWKEWTGALYIYCNIDDDLGLKKLSFYKRRSSPQANLFSYIVVVEVDTVTHENSLHLLDFVYRMKMKSMTGYIAVYQEHYPNGPVEMVSSGGSSVSPDTQTQAGASGVGAATAAQVDNSLDLNKLSL